MTKTKTHWRTQPHGSTWHAFGRVSISRVSLCGRVELTKLGPPQQGWARPPAFLRCCCCDGIEIEQAGVEESLPERRHELLTSGVRGREGEGGVLMRTPGKSPPRLAAGQSFNDEEVALLEVIVKAILRGGDLRLAQKSPVLGNVARKIAAMRASIEKTRIKRGSP